LNKELEKKIYLVGGAVRDKLLNLPLKDKDYVAVGYKEDEFSHLLRVGKDFPVFIQEDGSELALARTERKTSQGYNGFETNTQNVTLEDDLQRRDLSINSIAYDEVNDIYIDPYGGQKDLKEKLLRHTSKAFIEDPLRVLRLARFKAQLGQKWQIDPSTKSLVLQMKNELSFLQADRVWKEIEKVLLLPNTSLFFETLLELNVLDVIFPHIYQLTQVKENSAYHQEESVFVHTMMVLDELKDESALLKLTALYHDIAKPYCYKSFGSGAGHDSRELVEERIDINIPTKLKKQMLFLIENHIKIALLEDMRANKVANFLENFKGKRELLFVLLRFKEADDTGRITQMKKVCIEREKLLQTFEKISSYSPKEWIDSQINQVTNLQIKQHVHNKNIAFVKETYKDR